MSHKLQKPYTDEERADFIVTYNHQQGLNIEETDDAIFALEPWEKLVDGEVVDNTEEYEAEQAKQREEQFNKDFFDTSLGYVRRKVSMATGEVKDFLSDLLPTISIGVQLGNPVQIITYDKPDFTQEVNDWASLQNIKTVTAEFVQECFLQLNNDFKPVNNEVENEDTSNATKLPNELDSTDSGEQEANADNLGEQETVSDTADVGLEAADTL